MEVSYIDHMGGDGRTVNAARVSFKKKISEVILSGPDERLIQYLAKHNHWSPFSHTIITMVEKVPIFVARQRFKHFIGFVYTDTEEDGLEAAYNEVSRRYVDDPPEFFMPDVWRGKPVNAKQGSSDEIIEKFSSDPLWDQHGGNILSIQSHYQIVLNTCEAVYEQMIKDGVAPEQARMVLPQSMYTEYYVTGSLAAWARAYKLRSDSHAQSEIRDLAAKWNVIIGSIKELEHSWKALTE